MKKFLFISETYPSGLTGTSVKTRNTIQHLLKLGHKVDVACISFDTLVKKELKHKNFRAFAIREKGVRRFRIGWFWRVFEIVFTYKPFIVSSIFNKKVQMVFDALGEEYDKVFFDGFATLQYARKKDDRYIYIDDEDITYLMRRRVDQESNIFLKIFLYTEFLRSLFFEKIKLSYMNQVWAIAKEDQKRLKTLSSAKTLLMPTLIEEQKNCFSKKSKDFIFVGTLSWRENYLGLRWFIKNCWSEISDDFPDSKLLIVGQQGDDSWKKLIKKYKNIKLLGFVDELGSVFKKSAIAISPVFVNVGIKIKVLTYLSYGIPTVSTKISTGGMASTNGIYLANKNNFAKKTKELFKSIELKSKLSKEGWENIKKNHSNSALDLFFSKSKIFD